MKVEMMVQFSEQKGMLRAAAFENVNAPLNQGKRHGSDRALALCPGDEVSGSAGVQRKQVGSQDDTDATRVTWPQELGAGQRYGSTDHFLITLRGWCVSAAL